MAENPTRHGTQVGRTVYVDDQPITVDTAELTIRQLLELAGTPTEVAIEGEAVVREMRGDRAIEHQDLEKKVTVSEEARFYTRNPSPWSEAEQGPGEPGSSELDTGTIPFSKGVNTSSSASGLKEPADASAAREAGGGSGGRSGREKRSAEQDRARGAKKNPADEDQAS